MLTNDLLEAKAALFDEGSEAPLLAARFMKSLSHPDRLKILCVLSIEEQTVTEIEQAVGASQSSVSQHLSKLKDEGIVSARRDGRQIIYSIQDQTVLGVIEILYHRFCAPDG